MLGFETGALVDPAACKKDGHRPCALWLTVDNNCVLSGDAGGQQCNSFLERSYAGPQLGPGRPGVYTIRGMIVRGRLSTVRKDLTYDKSVPRSARVGFGHLGAYPAEIKAEQMEVERP